MTFDHSVQSLNENQLNLGGENQGAKRFLDLRRETVAAGNVHVQTKPGLTAGISGSIKSSDLLLQLLEAGTELFVQLVINICESFRLNDDSSIDHVSQS